MTEQEQLDALKASIETVPTRDNIISLLDIFKDEVQPTKDEKIGLFLDNYPTVKKNIMADLLSYSNYVSITEEA